MSRARELAIELGAPRGDVEGRRVLPMLCAQDDAGGVILGSRAHVFELKLDGVRIVADKRGDLVRLAYRRLRDATASYPEVARAVASLPADRVVLDGEIVAFDAKGHPDFQLLGRRIQAGGASVARAAAEVPVCYLVFDVLAIEDRDLRRLPLEARRAILEELVPDSARGTVRLPPTFDDGVALFRTCVENGLEGVVAKRRGSVYRDGDRTTDWVKVKNLVERDLVVVGWTEGEGRRSRLGALDLAAYEDGDLVACGSVGSGLDEDTIDALLPTLRALEVPKPTARGRRTPDRSRRHVRPELVVSVRFMSLSADRKVRAPVFRGVRPDARLEDCVLDASEVEAAGESVPVDAVALRVEGPRGAATAVATAARAIRDVAIEIGLPSLALAAMPGSLDVLLATGSAPEAARRALAEIVLRLVASDRARARVLVRPPSPWSQVDPVRVAMPLGWDELERFVAEGARAEVAAARRAALGPDEDPALVLRGEARELGAAVVALEALVARWAGGGPAR